MNIRTKNEEARRAQCESVGRDIDELQSEQIDLRNQVNSLEDRIHDAQLRVADIEQRLEQITDEQDAIRAVAGRGGVPGTIAGEVTAQLIALARQKDASERELERRRSELSQLDALLQQARRRLENVDHLLSRLHAAFDRLGCGISDRRF